MYHSVCSENLDVAELCALLSINIVGIAIFRRLLIIEGQGFDLLSQDADPIGALSEE